MSVLQNSGPSFEIMIKVRYYIHKFGSSVDIEMVDIMVEDKKANGMEYAFQTSTQLVFVFSYEPSLLMNGWFSEKDVKKIAAEQLLYMEKTLKSPNTFKPFNQVVESMGLKEDGLALTFDIERMSTMNKDRDVDWFHFGIIMLTMLTGQVPYRKQSLRVSRKPLIPENLKNSTKSFLIELFDKKKKPKLMLNGGGFKNHPYFAGIDWKTTEAKMERKMPWMSIMTPSTIGKDVEDFLKSNMKDEIRHF